MTAVIDNVVDRKWRHTFLLLFNSQVIIIKLLIKSLQPILKIYIFVILNIPSDTKDRKPKCKSGFCFHAVRRYIV